MFPMTVTFWVKFPYLNLTSESFLTVELEILAVLKSLTLIYKSRVFKVVKFPVLINVAFTSEPPRYELVFATLQNVAKKLVLVLLNSVLFMSMSEPKKSVKFALLNVSVALTKMSCNAEPNQ